MACNVVFSTKKGLLRTQESAIREARPTLMAAHALNYNLLYHKIFNMGENGTENMSLICKTARGEYNVENLKLIRHHHKNCKTHPQGKNLFTLSITKELVRFFT